MHHNPLALEQAPPIAVPVRFFVTAPLFGVAAAVGLMVAGPALLHGRWSNTTLGVTHLLTLGFLAMTMFGALMQLLPVLAGSPVRHARIASLVLHALLTGGALLLGFGLWLDQGLMLRLAVPALALAFGGLIAVAGYSLVRAPAKHASVRAMGFALAALFFAAIIGLLLAAGHAGQTQHWPRSLTDVHLAWALVGWVALLVVGVSYQVVPMFQMTPEYPAFMMRWLVPVTFITLILWSASRLAKGYIGGYGDVVSVVLELVVVVGLVAYAVMTLALQAKRRRRLSDTTRSYWRLGMLSLIVCGALWLIGRLWPALAVDPRYAMALGVLYLLGFAVSVISGMLHKIVPFLVWLHLQRLRTRRRDGGNPVSVPNMKEIIPEVRIRQQFRLYVAGFSLLMAAVLWPGPAIYLAGGLLVLAWLKLWLNLVQAVRVYRQFSSLPLPGSPIHP